MRFLIPQSAFRYNGKGTDAQTVGRGLGVRAVFEGKAIEWLEKGL
jgi:hypothetical protein